MAITVIHNPEDYLVAQVEGTKKRAVGKIAGPASYATNGFAADIATDFGITGTIETVEVTCDGGTTAEWLSATKKIKAYSAFETEATNTDNLSAIDFTLNIWYYD